MIEAFDGCCVGVAVGGLKLGKGGGAREGDIFKGWSAQQFPLTAFQGQHCLPCLPSCITSSFGPQHDPLREALTRQVIDKGKTKNQRGEELFQSCTAEVTKGTKQAVWLLCPCAREEAQGQGGLGWIEDRFR
jgi:hypothetical protein